MANDLNRVILVGRLVKDPETRKVSDTSVTNFSIANNREYKKEKSVSYFECSAWSKTGEIIAEYCKKGMLIGIDGRIQQRSWQDKNNNTRYKVEVVIENFQFLDYKKNNDTTQNISDNNIDNIPF